jgi:hypothetical protein
MRICDYCDLPLLESSALLHHVTVVGIDHIDCILNRNESDDLNGQNPRLVIYAKPNINHAWWLAQSGYSSVIAS